MTFTTFVMFDMFNALCCRSADKIVPQMEMFANKAFIYSVGGSLLGQVRVVVHILLKWISRSHVRNGVRTYTYVYSQVHSRHKRGVHCLCYLISRLPKLAY